MKKTKKVKLAADPAAKPCPNCGYCQQCGRSNHVQVVPYVIPYPYVSPTVAPYQWWMPSIWSGPDNDTTSGTITVTSTNGPAGPRPSLTSAAYFGVGGNA